MALKQHAVPQHIASYEFRLVGDMTLKQFGYLAGGLVMAFFFYAIPIAFYFKWPLVIFFGVLGIGLAFFPIEERPLSEWIVAFFKSVFSPTYFVWNKRAVPPAIFLYQASKRQATLIAKNQMGQMDRQSLVNYLQTLPKSKTDLFDKNRLDELDKLFQLMNQEGGQATATVKPIPATLKIPPVPQIQQVQPRPTVVQGPVVPPNWTIKKPGFTVDAANKTAVEATINKQLPIPSTPSSPNIIVGMVVSPTEEIIAGAILEIRNGQGIPVRALKTNQLGQFMIATPLDNGAYEIETEKQGYIFDIIKIEVKGEIIQPIEIRAKTDTTKLN